MRREGPRVLHLATSIAGGAGIAAWRIHEALLNYGIDSHFLTQGARPITGAHFVTRSTPERVLQKSSTAANRWLSNPDTILFTPISAGVVSIDDIARFSPDILHVHNWYNFFDWSLAPELVARGISVVATMHDERLLTGGCHYTLDCRQAIKDCHVCPQSRLPRASRTRRRRAMLRERLSRSQTLLISPSFWLRDRAKALGALEHTYCEVIPNCVSPALLAETTSHRRQGRTAIGFVLGKAPGTLQTTLDEVAHILGPSSAAKVDIFGAGDGIMPRWAGGRRVRAGRIDSDVSRARFWDSVDVGLFVTRSDNFPNTILEGMSRGVPQVVPDIGGAPEAVRATGGGLAVESTARALAEGVVRMIEHEPLRRSAAGAARSGVEYLYAPAVIAQFYAEVYARVSPSAEDGLSR